ncbi:hypothetical protein DOK67_0000051 [Enterococcus sp. DIV0212c]|uniref:Ig-like domain-containing protein n=1 Tax=Enterococcus sp. DIV0212c TaxID=2230867 RepID=UPI001A9B9475|nr:Ig-like domain-containing protein [Enterococcus sp. DIV0212c]MBO1353917.1 WxL domain-containing protein [Enterococcus sp. DIV0212c]
MGNYVNKVIKFTVVSVFLLMLIFSYSYSEKSNNSLVKAETNSIYETKDTNLLSLRRWKLTYQNNTGPGDEDYKRVKSSTYLRTDQSAIPDRGMGNLTNDGVFMLNSEKNKYIQSGSSVYSYYPLMGVTQEVSLTVGRYYQYSFDMKLLDSWSTTNNYVSVSIFSKQVEAWDYSNILKETWFNKKKNFIAKSANEELFLTAGPAEGDYFTSEFKNIQLIDITDKALTILTDLRASVEALFTDKTQSKIKLSTTQAKIDALKSEVSDYSDLLSAADAKTASDGLAKAEKLLNNIIMSLSVVNLEDNQAKPASYTITGKTAPDAFLQFSSDIRQIPEGNLSSEVEGDQTKYQIRADQNGTFQYKLPKDTYFESGEAIRVNSMLNGKTATVKMIVKDTTPPLQPSLNPPKDRDSTFSGMAEKQSTVRVYDKADKSLIVSGTAGIDGHYALTIPEAKKPLKPYKEYYVTATDKAGNVSTNSATQLVADTIPPTAVPVKQVLTLGDPLPELSKLVTAIADNAGAENVVVEQTKSPDLSKVGYTTAEITLTDAAKNKTVVIVPIVVKDAQTALDENNLLDARDFTIPAIYYPETEEAQKKFLLESSQASAWDIIKGKNIVEQITIDKKNLVKEPGSYNIAFQVGNIKKEITVKLTAGDITFDHVPSSMSFGTPLIQSKKQLIKPTNNIKLSIMDTRFDIGDWRLMAQLTHPLKTSDGHSIEDGIVYQKKEANGEWSNQTISDRFGTEVFSNKNANTGTTTVSFHDENELILAVSPGSVYSGKAYSTQFIWTLENAP